MLLEPFAHSSVTEAGEDGIIDAAVLQNFLNRSAIMKWPGVRR